MQLEAITLHLRPRPMDEACDLGVRMVQVHARAVWASFLPPYALVLLLAVASARLADWLPAVMIFWLKPWLDRSVLYVLSRAAFGMATTPADLWRSQRRVWWRQWLPTLTTRRLSPWRSFVAPAQQLEGQDGAAGALRRRQLLRGRQGAALRMHGAFANAEGLFVVGVLMLASLFIPETTGLTLWRLLLDSGETASHLFAAAYALVVGLLEPFYVGAGFAMYLNRRVELEAWDLEQELRLVFAS